MQQFPGADAESSTVGKAMRNLQAHVRESRHIALIGKGWMYINIWCYIMSVALIYHSW